MEKKYELTDETIKWYGKTLHRIKALKDFGDIKEGDLGGYIEKEDNLSHNNDCWICGNAQVFGNAEVYGNTQVFGDAEVCGDAQVFGNAIISSNDDYITFGNIGSRHDTTTMYRCSDGIIRVSCGCFSGTLKEFRNKVGRIHGFNKYAKEYEAIIKVAKIHFGIKRL